MLEQSYSAIIISEQSCLLQHFIWSCLSTSGWCHWTDCPLGISTWGRDDTLTVTTHSTSYMEDPELHMALAGLGVMAACLLIIAAFIKHFGMIRLIVSVIKTNLHQRKENNESPQNYHFLCEWTQLCCCCCRMFW